MNSYKSLPLRLYQISKPDCLKALVPEWYLTVYQHKSTEMSFVLDMVSCEAETSA